MPKALLLLYVVILAVGIFAGVICCKYANKKNNSSTLRDVLTGGMTESAFLQQAAAGLKNKGDSFTAVSMKFENWDKIKKQEKIEYEAVSALGSGCTAGYFES